MMMEVTVEMGANRVAWAQLDLDYNSKTWYVQENAGWGSLGIAKQGYMQLQPTGTMVLGNQVIQNQGNVIVLNNAPVTSPDPERTKGVGTLPDPFNSNYQGAKIRWTAQHLSPLRMRILEICAGILPPTPDTYLTPGKPPMTRITSQTHATGGVTNCGVFPGWVAEQLGGKALVTESVQLPKYTNAENKVITPDPIRVTSPMTAWEEFIRKVEGMRGLESGALWTPYEGGDSRPQPGDIFTLCKTPNGKFAHVGVAIDTIGSMWITADAGQGTEGIQMVPDPDDPKKKIAKVIYSKGLAAGYRRRMFNSADGSVTGEFGHKAYLKGWVNVDRLFAGWKP